MKTKLSAILLILLSTLITACGQFFLKKGADALEFSIALIAANYPIMIGLALYAVGALILIYALKNGELSVIYPIYSATFVWIIFISAFCFNETINTFKILGIVLIIGGVCYMGIGSRVKT